MGEYIYPYTLCIYCHIHTRETASIVNANVENALPGQGIQEQGYYDRGQYDAREIYGAYLEYLRVRRPFQIVDGVITHYAEIRPAQPQLLFGQH